MNERLTTRGIRFPLCFIRLLENKIKLWAIKSYAFLKFSFHIKINK